MGIDVRLATAEDMEPVFRLRYDVYVTEMHVPQRYADHDRRTIREPLDETADVLVAYDGDRLVGTARLNLGTRCDFAGAAAASDAAAYATLFRMAEFTPYFPRRVSVRTKMMVRPEYRNTWLAIRLLAEGYRLQVHAGIEFDFSDCREERWEFVRRMGYRQLFPPVEHPEDGRHVPVVLVVRDRDYLDTINPRLARMLPACEQPPAAVEFFYQKFPEQPRAIP